MRRARRAHGCLNFCSAGVLLLCAFLPLTSALAQISLEKQSQIEAVTSRFMVDNKIPGIAVAIVEKGEYEWSKGFGMADLEAGVPAGPQTLYRLASISKTITATAAMRLAEDGKLDLDAPLHKYCPAFPTKGTPITTRELLAHIAGIRHYKTTSPYDSEIRITKHFDDPIQGSLELFKNDPLVATPGTSFRYSTYGYTLVGCAIEGASGQKYSDYVRKTVLVPAGMTQTQIDDRLAIIPNRARLYSYSNYDSGAVINADCNDLSARVPGDGWLSSAEDMAKFEVAILNDLLLKRATRDEMWTVPKTADGKQSDYALGWQMEDKRGLPSVEHGGGEVGTSTFIIMVPKLRAGIVVLLNLNGGNAFDLASQLIRIVISDK